MSRLLIFFVACLSILAAHTTAFGGDAAISAVKLILKRSASGSETLTFVTKDPGYLFPGFGTADDPSTGSPGGARLELFANGQTYVAFDMPLGNAASGWTATNSGVLAFVFKNKGAPNAFSAIRTAHLRRPWFNNAKLNIGIKGKSVGLPLTGSQGPIAVRITTGTLRNCAIFDATTIVEDATDRFIAKDAPRPNISDCSTQTLGGTVCGNDVREGGEACDGTDTGACLAGCASDCTCLPACGDDIVNQPSEQCDGTDDSACPGACLPDCKCPVCGDNSVNQTSEQCDGSDDSACPAQCQPNCRCLGVCGDNLVNQSSEECDGTDHGVCTFYEDCRPPGAAQECTCCSQDGANCDNTGCCDPHEYCLAGTHASVCCASFGHACSTTSDCCPSVPCGSGGTCCAPVSGFPCSTNAECCPPLTCSGGACG